MNGVTSAAQRNSMRMLRDQIDQRLVSFGFTNANAKSPVGRMRYVEALQRNVVAHDLRGEMTQQLSPAPKPRNARTQPIFFVLSFSIACFIFLNR
jgi:hypothetical protein